MPGLSPDQVQRIHEFIHKQQLVHAIKLYREATGASLAEAKQAVEEMARDEFAKPPSGAVDYDNPILEARIRSLLAGRRKIDAVKVYREEYGVGLKEAKDAVDGIQRGMRLDNSSMDTPHESAIGQDPFAERDPSDSRILVAIAVAIAIALFGVAVFFLMMN